MMTLPKVLEAKSKRKLTMVTCYDSWSAKLLAKTDVDMILVGDSLAMVVYGYPDTTRATMDLMVTHTEAVRRGAPQKFIIGDLPFLSFRKSMDSSIEAAGKLIQAGANAVKLEGAKGNLELIERLTQSGVPVMGHLGLTPQFVHAFGGFKVQAKSESAQEILLRDALALEEAGAFSVVLECVPSSLAKQVSEKLSIPVIGIGAGVDCDGQVLVLHDLLGMTADLQPRFVRKFGAGEEFLINATQSYTKAVKDGDFPSVKESYE